MHDARGIENGSAFAEGQCEQASDQGVLEIGRIHRGEREGAFDENRQGECERWEIECLASDGQAAWRATGKTYLTVLQDFAGSVTGRAWILREKSRAVFGAANSRET